MFDSWMEACEITMDLAEEEAMKRLTPTLQKLTEKISDEMIETVEEYVYEAKDTREKAPASP